jgi:hypothetical protein
MTTQEQLSEIVSQASSMIKSGVLLINVTKHFLNMGINEVLTQKLVRLAEIEANQFLNYKAD